MPYHYDSRNYDPSATYKPELLPPGDYLCRIRMEPSAAAPAEEADIPF